MPRMIVIGVLAVTLLATVWTVLAQPGSGPLPRSSLSGGGGLSYGGRFTLSGFISRTDAGRQMTGENFSLQGGFQTGIPNPRPRVCGDQNNDHTVNVVDVIIDLQIIAELINPTAEQMILGDVVRDGEINILDVIYTLRYIVGLANNISGCGLPAPQARVEEVPNLVITAEDPILQGRQLDPKEVLGALPPAPPEFQDRGAHDRFDGTQWTFLDETELGPGQTQTVPVSLVEPALLQTRVTWFGALVPMEMMVTVDGTTLATGTVHPAPPNRGTITADLHTDSPGNATVSVTNKGSVPVDVRMVIGVLPLSVVP